MLLCVILFLLINGGCDSRFRLAPKKGRPHPHHSKEDTYNRTWVYKHEKGTPSPFSEEELAYRAKRAEEALRLAELYDASAIRFDGTLGKMRIMSPQQSASIFHTFLLGWFDRVLREGYEALDIEPSDQAIPSSVLSYLSGCSTSLDSLNPHITQHLHYGDDAADTEMYYEVFNGLFPVYQDDSVCRVFRIDVLRFGHPKGGREGAKVDTDKILSLFAAEDPSSEQAWSSQDPADVIDMLEPDLSEVAHFENKYSNEIKALFNFLWNTADDPLGIRFEEIIVSKRCQGDCNPKRSEGYTMVLLKDNGDVIEAPPQDKDL